MERIIVYGLGSRFLTERYWIEKNYDVVGYCDRDNKKVVEYPNGITLEMLLKSVELCDKILITPAEPWRIIEFLERNIGISYSKMELLRVPMSTRSVWLPECVFHGRANEDAILLLLLNKVQSEISRSSYIEIGLDDAIKNSFTFFLYQRGAAGTIIGTEKKPLNSQVFRPRDVSLELKDCELVLNYLQKASNIPDILIFHEGSCAEMILRKLDWNAKKPLIIMAAVIREEFKQFMQTKGYIWYVTTSTGIMAFYKRNDGACDG